MLLGPLSSVLYLATAVEYLLGASSCLGSLTTNSRATFRKRVISISLCSAFKDTILFAELACYMPLFIRNETIMGKIRQKRLELLKTCPQRTEQSRVCECIQFE